MDIINEFFNKLSEKLPFSFLDGNFNIAGFAISKLFVLVVALALIIVITIIAVMCSLRRKYKNCKKEKVVLKETIKEENRFLSNKAPTAPAYSHEGIVKASVTTDYEDVVLGGKQLHTTEDISINQIEGDVDISQIIFDDLDDKERATIQDEFDFDMDMDIDALSDFGDTQPTDQEDTPTSETDDIEEQLGLLDEDTQEEQEEEQPVEVIWQPEPEEIIEQPVAQDRDEQPEQLEEIVVEECDLQEAKEEDIKEAAEEQPEQQEHSEDDDYEAIEEDTQVQVAADTAREEDALQKQVAADLAPAYDPIPKAPLIVPAFVKPTNAPPTVRYERSFSAKLIQSEGENKAMYNLLKNLFMSYGSVRNSMSWNYESFIYGRNLIARLYLIGKTLRLFLALDPKEYDVTIYHQEDKGHTAKYKSVPMMVKITSKLALKRAVSLVLDLARKNELTKKGIKNIDYVSKNKYQPDEVLLKKGLIRVENPHKYKLADTPTDSTTVTKLDEESKEKGKYAFEKKEDKVYFSLCSDTGEVLLKNPNGYTTVQGAKRGIATFKKAVKEGAYSVVSDKTGYRLKLKAPSARFAYYGTSKQKSIHAENDMAKVQVFAESAVIIDKVI